ncbi:kinase-like domain-containing protein [Rhizophagus clarus]|uniref:Kinase-like domain-containing protein n=1 Tax=Rhizophagus clarus TaxID=94130 RepID=A0A8H3LUR8_9GLOM|nr:kinase-like domain-containing protein [Rhizophagus clarus]
MDEVKYNCGNDCYGLSHNPDTKIYIFVFNNRYFEKYCDKCSNKFKHEDKWCNSCQMNNIKNNFTKWTSGNEKIDDFIREEQLKYDGKGAIFEWIQYNEFTNIKEIGDNCSTIAIWKDGPLIYKKLIKKSHEVVCLKYLFNSLYITSELLNEVELHLKKVDDDDFWIKGYGISQNPDTKIYILVFNENYFNYCCDKCNNNGIEKIDNFIREKQLKYNGNGPMFEWIPYNNFINIEKIKKDVFTAIWKDGPLYHSKTEGKYKRKINEKILLKNMYDSQNANSFLNKITFLIKESYGISKNPKTLDFILVLRLRYYCEYCGKRHDNKFEIDNKSCILCQTNHENEKINGLIQEMRLNTDYYSTKNYLFEWIPYDQFYNISYIAKGGFGKIYKAIWKSGLLCYDRGYSNNWKRKPNTKVALKCLNNSQYITDEFINAVKVHSHQETKYILDLYGISQDPETKNYIIVLQYAESGNLRDYLEKNDKNFDWFSGLKVLNNIFDGLNEIHQNGMIHRDFHIGNILFTKIEEIYYKSNENHYNAFISDMGLCRKVDDVNETNVYGVLPYVAPEVLRGCSYAQSADIYSFGMIMYVIATGRQPFADCAHDSILAIKLCNGIRPEINEQIAPKIYIDLMKRCWDPNPDNRPLTIYLKEMIELFHNSLNQNFKEKEQQHYEIEKQFNETQECRKKSLLSVKNSQLTIHPQAVYTSRLLNPFIENLSKYNNIDNNTVEIIGFTNL